MEDMMKLKGHLEITLTDKNGRVKDFEKVDNLIVSVGKAHIIDQLVNAAEASMSHMAVGTSSTAAVVGDTALGAELAGSRKVFDSKTQGTSPNDNQVTYTTTWGSGEAVGALAEAAIFNAASGGTMLNRTTFAVKNKLTTDTLTIAWVVTIP